MVNWKPVKEAITSTEDSVVPDGVWSSGSTWDKNGVAYPKDLSDPELTEWVIYDELAVIQKQEEGRNGFYLQLIQARRAICKSKEGLRQC